MTQGAGRFGPGKDMRHLKQLGPAATRGLFSDGHMDHIAPGKESSMPVTSFAMLILLALVAAGMAVAALKAWGVVTLLAILAAAALFARWALAHVPYDDRHS